MTNTPLAVIIVLPVIFGFFGLIGTWFMGEHHSVLKIFMYLLSLVSVFGSFYLGQLVLAQEWVATAGDLTEGMGFLTYIYGWIFATIIVYFLIYAFIKLTHRAAQKEKEKLEY